jgi:uncharacterized protein (DUF58 family)
VSSSLRIALSLLGISLFGLAVSGQSIYSRLSYLWFFLIVGNYFLSRIALRGLQIDRKARSLKAQVGEIYEETFELRNLTRMPRIWTEVQDESGLHGSRGSRVLTLIGGRKTRSYVSRTRLTHRGAYPLGPTVLHSGDPFGFFPVSQSFPFRQTLTVYPRVVDIFAFPSPAGLLPGGEAIRKRSQQITPNAATVRDYVNGDPMSRIHWASTARRDKLIVKEFELDPLAEVWLFLDAEKTVQSVLPHDLDNDVGSVLLAKKIDNKLAPTTEEYSASLAASVAQFYLLQGRAVGFMAAGHSLDVLAVDRGSRQFGKIMETLALLRANGEISYEGFVSSHARHITRGSTVVLITPSTSQELALLADQLIRLGLRPIVLLLNALTFGGPTGSDELATAIDALGVPHMLVSEGEDLAATFR